MSESSEYDPVVTSANPASSSYIVTIRDTHPDERETYMAARVPCEGEGIHIHGESWAVKGVDWFEGRQEPDGPVTLLTPVLLLTQIEDEDGEED